MTRTSSRSNSSALIIFLAALLLAGYSSSLSAAAAKPKITTPVSKDFVKIRQKKSIRRTERKLAQITKRVDGMVAQITDFQQRNVTDLMADNQVKARLHEMVKQQSKLKKELQKLKEQTVRQYAASRNIPLIPDPPLSSPPPLPPSSAPQLLSVAPRNAEPVKSHRPPGGAVKLTIDPQI